MIVVNYLNEFSEVKSLIYKAEYFPNGELKIKLQDLPKNSRGTVTYFIFDKNTIHDDMFILKYLALQFGGKITSGALFLSFLPYSRMDREDGHHGHTMPVILRELVWLGFSDYIVTDPHNLNAVRDYSMGHLNTRFERYFPTEELIAEALEKYNIDAFQIVMPDSGAKRKYLRILESSSLPLPKVEIASGHKVRDGKTGHLVYKGIELLDCNMEYYLIVDDICSGGMTFKLCAEAIKKANPKAKILLVVSHFEEGGGKSILNDDAIEHIFTTDSMCNIDHPKVTQLEIFKRRKYEGTFK